MSTADKTVEFMQFAENAFEWINIDGVNICSFPMLVTALVGN